ncbi:MAG: HU family DNA-binding protein [Prevotella sp.]|nr:HU family DNA-binding protein [Prevotella sp.]
MSIKYDIHVISNAKGEGDEQKYVRPILMDPMTRRELEDLICHRCTLTESDLEAVFSAISQLMVEELSSGHRFYLPGVGYFSIQAGLTKKKEWDKVKGKHLFVDGISFRPEAAVLSKVQGRTRFEHLDGTTRSQRYTEAEMVGKVKDYLQTAPIINRRIMENEFHLRCNMARTWLKRLVDLGVLVKDGSRTSPVYYMNKEDRA